MNEGGIKKRIAASDYMTVAQLFLRDNFLLSRSLEFADIKPRLLGHWGTCHGINVFYANVRAAIPDSEMIIGPGHGFPALQANLFLDGELEKYYPEAKLNFSGLEYVCRNFSWPYGFPSHAFPGTPGVVLEGGELGYCLATGYGVVLGKPEKFVAVLIGDGEFETGTALASMNLSKLVASNENGKVLPVLHLNGYKISGPTIYGRKSERELLQLLRGFGYAPTIIDGDDTSKMQEYLRTLDGSVENPFLVMRTEKGETGPKELRGEKIAGNYLSHQIPLPLAGSDQEQLEMLERWLRSYKFREIWDGITR